MTPESAANQEQARPTVRAEGRRGLVLLLTAILITRVVFAFAQWQLHGPDGWTTPDSDGPVVEGGPPRYLQLARSLAKGRFTHGSEVELNRPPGYPLLLVPGVVLGFPLLGGIVVNLLASLASGWLIWRIVLDETGNIRAALAAGVFFATEPLGLIYSSKVLTETLFAAQMLLFVWWFLRALRGGDWKVAALAGAALAFSAYTRPVTVYLGLPIGLLFLFGPRTLSVTQRVGRMAAFHICFLLLLAPWVYRNYIKAGYPGFSTISTRALYFYSAAAVRARLEKKGFAEMQKELGWSDSAQYFRSHPEQQGWNAARIARAQQQKAKEIITQNAPLYAKMHLRGSALMMLDPGITDMLKALKLYPEAGGLLARTVDQGIVRAALWLVKTYPASIAVMIVLGVLLLASYAFGLYGLKKMHFQSAVALLLIFLYFAAVSGGPVAMARYRHPLMVFLCIGAGIGWAAWRARREERAAPRTTSIKGQ